jgi:hypothetical protein
VKHLSQKELVHEGFGSFMGKLGAGIGAAGRELGKQLLKDAPTLTGAAKSMGSIIKAATDTDPLIAIKNFLKDDMWAKKHINDDMKARGSLGKPGPAKDSGGKVKNKNIIHVPIIRGKYVNPEGIEEDFAGGHISMMRDADGGWKVDNFFGPNDPNKGVKPASTPTVTSGRPAPGEGPGTETGEATPGAEIEDSKGTPMKVGDRVEFTKGAKELKNIQGEIESIQGPEDITIRCGPEGCPPDNRASMAGVHPKMVVQVAAGAGADPGAEPPAEASTTDSEAEPPAEASTTDEVEPPAEPSTTDEAEPEPESRLGAAPSKEDVELAKAGVAKAGFRRDGNEMNAIKRLKNYMIDTKVTKGDEEVPGGRRTIAKKVQEDQKFRPTIAGSRINNGTAKKLLESKQSQKEVLRYLTLLAR